MTHPLHSITMEVIILSPPRDFNFDSSTTTPYLSATSSPQRFNNFFYSAPASPTRFYGAAVPFNWEQKPGTPKSHTSTTTSSNYGDAEDELNDVVTDFAFDFSGDFERNSLPADELFDGGKIKPLKPPPRFHYDQNKPLDSPKSPKSPKEMIREAFSPRHRKKTDVDPFTVALEQTRREGVRQNATERTGRKRTISNSRSKNSRSLSPFRVSDLLFEPETNQEQSKTTSSSSSSSFWYKKWKIKDLLLFRSASEGRAKDKEQLKKYSQLKKTRLDDVKNSSFRSTDSVGSVSSRRKSGAPISAHEWHYTVNRAFSEEMKKRTFLPYKQGLLGCLGFHPSVGEMSFSSTGSLSRG